MLKEYRRFRNQCPLEEFATYAVSAYIAYLFISISVTIWGCAGAFQKLARLPDRHLPAQRATGRCGQQPAGGGVLPDQCRLRCALLSGQRSADLAGSAWPARMRSPRRCAVLSALACGPTITTAP